MDDPFWQIVIGTGIGGLLLALWSIYRSYLRESKEHNESQRMAKVAIVLSIFGLFSIGLGSILGILIGFTSMKGKKFKALSKIAVVIGLITLFPWILVAIFGS